MALAASGLMPTRQADKAEMREVIRQAVGTLNDRQKLAVLLSKFESMSYEEIAQSMEMTPKAVKSLLARARGNLRDVLDPTCKTVRFGLSRRGLATPPAIPAV